MSTLTISFQKSVERFLKYENLDSVYHNICNKWYQSSADVAGEYITQLRSLNLEQGDIAILIERYYISPPQIKDDITLMIHHDRYTESLRRYITHFTLGHIPLPLRPAIVRRIADLGWT